MIRDALRYNLAPMRWQGALAVAVWLVACKSYKTEPLENVPLLQRAETETEGRVRVSVAVPTAAETKQLFGVNLWSRKIQPVWIRIENRDEKPRWLLPMSVDPDYYPPGEVSYRSHFTWSSKANKEMDRHIDAQHISLLVPAGGETEGYVYTNLDEGVKVVNVDLLGPDGIDNFLFIVPIPGMTADVHGVDFDSLYQESDRENVDEAALRKALEGMPRATMNKKGTREGDPLNLVVIGDHGDVFGALLRRGWDPTEALTSKSMKRTTGAFLFGGRYRYSPVSPLHVFGRGQDLALQKIRNSIHQRNHLRLWLTAVRYEGKPVWLGQISRDIGVKVNVKSPTIVTHKVDADVDEAREYLLQDMIYSGNLAEFGYVKGVGLSTRAAPRKNLGKDPFFTDGFRVVVVLDEETRAPGEIRRFDWERRATRR